MRKVLFNLLSNAFKHVPDKGEISMLISTTPDQVITAAKDFGNGISRKEQERIFDRFYQADNQNKAIHVDTGIGLALTKNIIQLRHGTIEVESELNEGGCFIMKLLKTHAYFEEDTEAVFPESSKKEPVIQESAMPGESFMEKDDSMFETPSIDGREGKWRILLVEDNVELLYALKEILSLLYQVVTTANGKERLKQVFAEVLDLIVSDVMMPVTAGTEMRLKIRNNINLYHIPIILLTALNTVDQNIEGLCRGTDDYIAKSFNAKILITRCNNLIRSHLLVQSRLAKDQIPGVDPPAANPINKSFLDRVIKVVDKYLDNEDFGTGILRQGPGMERTLLHTKFKTLTGMTPNEFILNH